MSSSGIQLAELRAWAEREAAYQNSEEFNNWPVAAVLALVDAVEAAQRFERAYQDSLGAADAYSVDHRDTCQLALVARLSKFDFGAGVS